MRRDYNRISGVNGPFAIEMNGWEHIELEGTTSTEIGDKNGKSNCAWVSALSHSAVL
jgi:hypothetical protein